VNHLDPWLPRPPRFTRPACTKHRYPDKKSALTAINHRLHGHQRNRPEYLRAYPCPDCRGWHLTKNNL